MNLLINKLVRDVVDVERDILNSTEFTGERFFPLTDTEKLGRTTSQLINMYFTSQRWDQISTSLGCFYDYMEQANSTFYGAVVRAVSKDVYKDRVDRLVASLQLLLSSPDLVPGTVAVGQAVLDNLRSINYDKMWVRLYRLFLEVRTRLVQVDVTGMFEELNKLDRSVQEGWWRLLTGRWPSMEKFLGNMLDTVQSD